MFAFHNELDGTAQPETVNVWHVVEAVAKSQMRQWNFSRIPFWTASTRLKSRKSNPTTHTPESPTANNRTRNTFSERKHLPLYK
jgi:hypothetical protein